VSEINLSVVVFTYQLVVQW